MFQLVVEPSSFDTFAVFPILKRHSEREGKKLSCKHICPHNSGQPRSAIIFTFGGSVLLSSEVKMVAIFA